jgi:hypothetical protein
VTGGRHIRGLSDSLVNVIDENNTDAFQIFNVCEAGFFTVQRRRWKALGKKRMPHIAALSSGKREVSIILEYYVIALGNLCFTSGRQVALPRSQTRLTVQDETFLRNRLNLCWYSCKVGPTFSRYEVELNSPETCSADRE